MEFKLRNICLAVGLPFLAFLSLYWLKQRKKIGGGCSGRRGIADAIAEQVEAQSDDPAAKCDRQVDSKVNAGQDQSTADRQNESTVESQSTDCCAALDACCKAANRKSIDQDKTISSPDNQTVDQPSKLASSPDDAPVKLNNNDNDFKSKDQANDSSNANKSLSTHPTNDILSSPDKPDSVDLAENRSSSFAGQPDIDVDLDQSNEKPDELHASSKSLAEGEEMFETENTDEQNDTSRHRRHSSTANASTVNNESAKADTTVLTFDTARDLSINANDSSVRVDDSMANAGDSFIINDSSIDYPSSANATVDSSIRSLKNSTLGSMNCSAKTLRSLDDSKRDHANQLNDSKPKIETSSKPSNEMSNAADTVQRDEEVKEDYLNATAVNEPGDNTAKVDAVENANYESDEKPNSTEVDEVAEEKHLNVTEAEFKNDTVNQVVQAEISDETIKKDEDSAGIEEATKAADESENTINQSSADDSIIFDGVVVTDRKESQPACKPKPAQNGLAQPQNAAKESAVPKPAVNLDDSDVQIVFETCDDIKPKQLPGLNGKPAGGRVREKSGSMAGTPSKAVKQQVPNNHAGPLNEFTFELPNDLCGLMIGAKGGFINPVMQRTNTTITLLNHPTLLNMSLCSIKGHCGGINEALAIIRERFPLSRFPQVTLLQAKLIPVETISEAAQLHLPEGVSCDVIVSNFVTPKHLFLQQPTHASFHLLQRLDEYMISTYNYNETPAVDEPAVGIICAVQRGEGWYRAIVTDCSGPIKVRLLDYGGYITVPKSSLRQVQRDYMSIPFQAAECFLANIEPTNGVWSEEARAYFRSLTEKQFLQAFIVGYTEERIPNIQLFRIVNNKAHLINEELCDSGYAIYVN